MFARNILTILAALLLALHLEFALAANFFANLAQLPRGLLHRTRSSQLSSEVFSATVPLREPASQPHTLALSVPRTASLPRTSAYISELRGGTEKHASPLPIFKDQLPASSGTVSLKISINYGLDKGVVVVSGPSSTFGSNDVKRAPKLERKDGELWQITLKVPLSENIVEYNYVVISSTHRHEARISERSINLQGLKDGSVIDVQDAFRSPKPATLATSCFNHAIFGRGHKEADVTTENVLAAVTDLAWPTALAADQVCVRFNVYAPRIEAGHSIWVTGKPVSMGSWSADTRVPMVHIGHRIYVGQAVVKRSELPFEYKYVIVDAADTVVCKEKDARKVAVTDGAQAVVKDEAFNYPSGVYKASGVAIPVSGIKTRSSTGIGEFLDLKLVVDWCVKTGLQIIQILPINDSGEDPSPYSASSSFALHPSYLKLISVADYYEKNMGTDMTGMDGWAQGLVDKMNKNWRIDHPKILIEKARFMDKVFDTVGKEAIIADPGFQKWLGEAESWVKTYAAFKVQLQKEKSCNNKWFDCTTWSCKASDTEDIVRSSSPDYDSVLRVYFTQYHLHLQLLEATKYAEQNGVAIKGDIPIGVTRCSADVWAEPNLFKLDKNAGAPGDPQQNWGFPPYNWDEMHRDGCKWWRRRLSHMEQYFHAYRIDHVLGFFRMWEISKHGGQGAYFPQSNLREAGLRNLRAIQTASDMLICGEDLGNVPDEVPPVLLELGICGLRIQRWCDGQTWTYPYLVVAASSCHDCSPCRLWWNEEWGGAEGWYNFFVGKGSAPGGPPDWISQKIVKLHAESTALLTINPIQDYIDMWEKLRSENPKNDMINHPGQTDGCWVYRCHRRMEDLLLEDSFNGFIKTMLKDAGRGIAY